MDPDGALSGRGGERAVRELLLGAGQDALAGLLESMAGDRRAVRTLRLRRAHLKPGRKLSTEYDVELHGIRRPVAVAATWHCGGMPAGALAGAEAGAAELRADGVPAPMERLWAVDPTERLLVLAAPLDPAFPSLGPLSDPARLGAALAAWDGLLAGGAGAGAVRAVRYRPGQRHVLEYRRRGALPLFVKLYRPGEGGPVATAVHALAELLDAAGTPRIRAVRPAAVLGDGDALVYRRAPGTPLSTPLGAGVPPAAAHAAHVGLLLRTVHAARPPAPLPSRDLDGEVRTVRRACEAMAALRPELGALAGAIVDRAAERIAACEQEPPTPIHGDMKADHVLWGGRGLHVLDTDRCALADPALDLGKMLADLRVRGVEGGGSIAADAEGAVLDAYAGPAPRIDRARLYAALLLVRMAARRVPLAAPDWAPRTAAVLAAARVSLDAEGSR